MIAPAEWAPLQSRRPVDDLAPLRLVIGAHLGQPDNSPRVRYLARLVAKLLPVLEATPSGVDRNIVLEYRKACDLPEIRRWRLDYEGKE